jgi:Flp pilus assembly pilin Flp
MNNSISKLNPNITKETGATMVEYVFMASLIAVVSVAAVTLLGLNVSHLFESFNDAWTAATG